MENSIHHFYNRYEGDTFQIVGKSNAIRFLEDEIKDSDIFTVMNQYRHFSSWNELQEYLDIHFIEAKEPDADYQKALNKYYS